jgi:hypothetical protein
VRKGRHRRFEEARALKRSIEVVVEPCPECGADPEDEHASWCLATEDDDDEGRVGEDDADQDTVKESTVNEGTVGGAAEGSAGS